MTERKMIYLDDAIAAVEKESQVDGAYGYMDTKSIIDLLNDLPSAQPDPDKLHLQREQAYMLGWEDGRKALREGTAAMVEAILTYLDEQLHPIVSPDHWDVYSNLYDMVLVVSQNAGLLGRGET